MSSFLPQRWHASPPSIIPFGRIVQRIAGACTPQQAPAFLRMNGMEATIDINATTQIRLAKPSDSDSTE